jgi:hypothetical protein
MLKSICVLLSVAFCAATPRAIVPTEIALPLDVLFNRYYSVFADQAPSGTYEGAKSVLGQNIDATVTFESDTLAKFIISGAVSIDCDSEPYTYSAPDIKFTNVDKSGDCIHDALTNNNVQLESVTYDATADTIDVKVKYSIISITLELKKTSTAVVKSTEPVLPMAVLFERYFPVFAGQKPSGTYVGTKSILGQSVTSTVGIASDTDFSFSVAGPVSINCSDEAYTYADGTITVPNLDKSGDCLHDSLEKQHVKLKSFSYDPTANEIHVAVAYSVITINLTLKHQA